MRGIRMAITVVAAGLATGAFVYIANAAPLGNPAALVSATEEMSVLDSVHCRPGRPHHRPNRWRRADGCARRGAVIVPGVRYVIRDGVRVRVGSGGRDVRSRTSVRTRTTVRSRPNVESGSSTTIRSKGTTTTRGTSGVGRATGGEGKGTGGSQGGRGGAQQAPTGEGQQK